jgi:hypothetical protein
MAAQVLKIRRTKLMEREMAHLREKVAFLREIAKKMG